MSQLLARIMFVCFMLPASALVYFLAYELVRDSDWIRRLNHAMGGGYRYADWSQFASAGWVMWIFIAIYWLLLWRRTVRWTATRAWGTLAAIPVSTLLGVLSTTLVFNHLKLREGESAWFGSVLAPLSWLMITTLLWRESAAERMIRTGVSGGVACPNCGYNLTGLRSTRCPECGREYTLDELLATRDRAATVEFG